VGSNDSRSAAYSDSLIHTHAGPQRQQRHSMEVVLSVIFIINPNKLRVM
jgi:hypothetical protein